MCNKLNIINTIFDKNIQHVNRYIKKVTFINSVPALAVSLLVVVQTPLSIRVHSQHKRTPSVLINSGGNANTNIVTVFTNLFESTYKYLLIKNSFFAVKFWINRTKNK